MGYATPFMKPKSPVCPGCAARRGQLHHPACPVVARKHGRRRL